MQYDIERSRGICALPAQGPTLHKASLGQANAFARPKALDENGANVPLDPQTLKLQEFACGLSCQTGEREGITPMAYGQ